MEQEARKKGLNRKEEGDGRQGFLEWSLRAGVTSSGAAGFPGVAFLRGSGLLCVFVWIFFFLGSGVRLVNME